MGNYDQSMKLLVAANPLAIATLILRSAGIELPTEGIATIELLSTEFEGEELDADALLLITTIDGEKILLHIEFQSSRDTTMPDRQMAYCLRARKKHGYLPIISCVIYLRKDGNVLEPPAFWQLRNGRKWMIFDYVCIKLWEHTSEELLALNQPALLPLTLLTQGEKNRTMVAEMFQTLLDNRLQDVLPVAEMLAALVLKESDLAWLKREVSMLTDLFKESPAYEWMTEDAREEGRKEGREEGRRQVEEERQRALEERQRALEERQRALEERQRALKNFRETVVALVARDFPKLAKLAKKQVARVEDLERLQHLILEITMTHDAARAAELLSNLDEDEQV